MSRQKLVASGQGETANEVPIADGLGGYSWGAQSGSGGSFTGFSTTTTDAHVFVSKTGNDSNGTGTILAPFLTIGHALSSLAGNTTATIWIGSGVFQEEIWIGSNGQAVTLIGTGVPGSATATVGTVIEAPSDTTNCINVIGVTGSAIRDICTRNYSVNSAGCGIRILGSNQTKVTNWLHDNSGLGYPLKMAGGIGMLISHSEKCQINGYSVSFASKGIILGVEADEEHFITGQLSGNYQDIYAGPWEGYRSRLTSSVTSTATTLPIHNSMELPSSGLVYTKDYLGAPAQPTLSASGTGGTVPAGTYTVAVSYVDAYGRETVYSATQTQAVTSGQHLVITSPATEYGAVNWYAYVSQAGTPGTLYRQQASGSPTAIGTNLTLTADPTTTGTTGMTGTTAFASEGIAYTSNSGNSLGGLTHAIFCNVQSAITSTVPANGSTLTVVPLSPGNPNGGPNNNFANPEIATVLPTSGTLLVDSEQISWSGVNPIGNGEYQLQNITRGANSTTPASHAAYANCQDTSLASAQSHSTSTEVVLSYASTTSGGVWGGGCTFDVYKSTNCQLTAAPAGDYTEEWYSGGHVTLDWDSVEIITNLIRHYNSALHPNIHIGKTIAGASTVTDDTIGTTYLAPTGNGALILSSLSSGITVERSTIATLTDNNPTANSGNAVRTANGTTAPNLDVASAARGQALRYNGTYFVNEGEGVFYATDYGVKANGKNVTDASIQAGQAILSSSSAGFTSADAGKLIVVVGAGTPTATTLSSGLSTGAGITSLPIISLPANVPAGGINVSTPAPNLGSSLSTGSPITSIPLASALSSAISTGAFITITSGTNSQQFTVSSPSSGSSINVTSETPTFAFPSGSTMTISQPFVINSAVATATSLTVVASTTPLYAFPSGASVSTFAPALSTMIASVTGGVATLAANAGTTVGSAECFYATDDTANAQACITAAAAVDGTAIFPEGDIGLSSTLSTSNPVTILGQGVKELYGTGNAYNACNFPTQAPYLKGTVFVQTAPNVDILALTAQGLAQNAKWFGLRFAGRFQNTGHGLNATPSQYYGNIGGYFEDIRVFGVDGNHYGLLFTGPELNRLTGLRSYGGGGMQIAAGTAPYPPGNTTCVDFYSCTYIAGTAHGLYLNGSGLDYSVFIRPQTWVLIPTPALPNTAPPVANGPQENLACNGGSGMQYIGFVSPDFETNLSPGSTATFPSGFGCYRTNNGNITTGSANAFTGTANSGQSYQNPSGVAMNAHVEFIMQPAASAIASTTLSSSTSAGATSLTVASNTGFSAGQAIQIDTGTSMEFAIISSVSGGSTINLYNFGNYGLLLAHSSSATVAAGAAVAICELNSANSFPNGYGRFGFLATPIGTTDIKSMNFTVPTAWYFRLQWANATRAWGPNALSVIG